ncbi:MAG: LLM class flavin-dependent oxidoreductase [Acidobacteriota bacterium]|nr:LLM class flavin-dependent oxidoreductase [Acidobacteriota bacterium]
MKLGIWQPIFGGWLRNIEDEGMDASFAYNLKVAQAADRLGFSTILIAELNLNDIKGPEAPSLECWTTTAALAATTQNIRLMAALRPGFRQPALCAKMAANIDHISGGRFEINLVSAWWKEEMQMYVGEWMDHTTRYRRSAEFIEVMRGCWDQSRFSYEGEFYNTQNTALAPKPVQGKHLPIFAGGESDEGREMIAAHCDAYLMHGDSPENAARNVADMNARREKHGLGDRPLSYGMACYMVVRDTEEEARAEVDRITTIVEGTPAYHSYRDFVKNSHLKTKIDMKDYSVSNRGLRPGLVGTPEQVAARLKEYEAAGLDLMLVQCSPQLEEVERIGRQVIPLLQ